MNLTEILAIVGALAILFFVVRWFRLVWFRSSVLRVLENECAYQANVMGPQGPVFNELTRSARNSGWNEYDAAIAFMLVQLGSLMEPLDEEAEVFRMEKFAAVKMMRDKSTVGEELIDAYIKETRGA